MVADVELYSHAVHRYIIKLYTCKYGLISSFRWACILFSCFRARGLGGCARRRHDLKLELCLLFACLLAVAGGMSYGGSGGGTSPVSDAVRKKRKRERSWPWS